MLSFSLLLALSSAYPQTVYGVLLFIGICSLSVSSLCVALLASNLQGRMANLRIFQAFLPLDKLRWKHLVCAAGKCCFYSHFCHSNSPIHCHFPRVIGLASFWTWLWPQTHHHTITMHHITRLLYVSSKDSFFQMNSKFQFFSLALSISYLLTALTSLHEMSEDEDLDMKSGLVQKQQQKAQQYAELWGNKNCTFIIKKELNFPNPLHPILSSSSLIVQVMTALDLWVILIGFSFLELIRLPCMPYPREFYWSESWRSYCRS